MSETYDDLIDNPTPRCACQLVLDVSSSMDGAPIQELQEGIQQFIQEVKMDDFASSAVELGIITFGGTVQNITPIQQIEKIELPTLKACGMTPMGEAVKQAIQSLEERKLKYKQTGVSYYQPWLVLMSDGAPNDCYQEAAASLKKLGEKKKILVFAIGIGEWCHLDILEQFCPSTRPPKKLSGLKFKEFFSWLSQSMSCVSVSTPGTGISLPSTDGWGDIQI